MQKYLQEKYIHEIFDITIILKGIHSLLEVVSGLVILFISQKDILDLVYFLTQDELTEDPKAILANYLVNLAQNFSISSQHFVALYLLSHGIIKSFLILGLYKEKLWSYPLAIFVFSIFGFYQLFEFFLTHSLWLLLLTAFDVLIILLTWHEYKYMEGKKAQ